MVDPNGGSSSSIAANSLYQGLRAIWDTEFPKTCPKCGRKYGSFEEYLVDTLPLEHSSGLMGYAIRQPEEQVGLFRNCACGTTIMAFCHDRRDVSETGLKRRELFGQLLQRLVDHGATEEEARRRLLDELRKAPDVEEFLRAINSPPGQ